MLSHFCSEDHLKWWLTLWRTPGVGSAVFQTLYQHYKNNPEEIFSANKHTLEQLGMSVKSIDAIQAWRGKPDPKAHQDMMWLADDNHHLIHVESEFYPPLLQEITGAPTLLFVEGDPAALLTPQVAMVGSRQASTLGRETAFWFAKELAKHGITINSGLALGIDTSSHEGAIAVGGKTVAVLGTGVDVIYPSQNKKLARAIIEQGGAIVSEMPLGTSAQPALFPRRNRIISGLSLGVLVVEAAIKSGSLITARLASEQGREVFAIPGSIHNTLHKGCHHLIREGATLVETAQDITSALAHVAQFQFDAISERLSNMQMQDGIDMIMIDQQTKDILKHIGFEPTPLDVIVQRCDLSAAQISGLLMSLELDGWIITEPGGYTKTRKAKHIV